MGYTWVSEYLPNLRPYFWQNTFFASYGRRDGNTNSSDVFLLKGALGTNDLNNVIGTDYQGIWWQNATANATTARNYPVVSAGNLLVLYNGVSNYGITKIYITHASKRIFVRSKPTSTDAWTTWGEFWTSDNLVNKHRRTTPLLAP